MLSEIEYQPWDDYRLFLSVAETGSFSAAARQLGLGQPTVSRRIAQLEARLEEALFQRGVEGAVLTAAGERLLPSVRRMAESASELGRLMAGRESAPEGRVRVAAPPGLAFEFLVPFARRLRDEIPGLRLEVLSSIGFLDLARGEADLALRTRCPAQRDLVRLGELVLPVGAFASRDYAASLPPDYQPSEIDWITWAPPHHQVFPRPELEALIEDFEPVFTSDSYLVQLRAVESGVGAMVMAKPCSPHAHPAKLVELDAGMGPLQGQLHLVCAKSAQVVPRVRAVLDRLRAEMDKVEAQAASEAS